MKFVDISSNNPHPVNFSALRSSGFTAVRIKATQGDYYTNPDFGSDAAAAHASRLEWGAYMMWDYSEPLDPQLNYFHQHYGGNGDIRPAMDCEPLNGKPVPSWNVIAPQLARAAWILTEWYGDLDFYVDRDWKTALEPFGFPYNRGIWLGYGEQLGMDGNIKSVQFAPATVPGVNGPIDWSIGD